MDKLKKTYSKIISVKHKNIKLIYYLKSFIKLKFASKYCPNKLLKILIQKHQLQEYIYLIGFQNANVFVLPSLYEGMPNVLLEAMNHDIPVISTPVNGSRELIENETTRLFVKPKSPKEIYKMINSFLNIAPFN